MIKKLEIESSRGTEACLSFVVDDDEIAVILLKIHDTSDYTGDCPDLRQEIREKALGTPNRRDRELGVYVWVLSGSLLEDVLTLLREWYTDEDGPVCHIWRWHHEEVTAS